jgi:hypothetical protein
MIAVLVYCFLISFNPGPGTLEDSSPQKNQQQKSQSEGEATGWIYRTSAAAANLTADPDSDEAHAAVLTQVTLQGLDNSGFLSGPNVNLAPSWYNYHGDSFYYSSFAGVASGAAFSEDGTFHYDRSHPGLAEVNIYYWIDSAQRHLETLGLPARQEPIDVFAHALDGDHVIYESFLKALFFGDGTVQTALDPSIVLHNYSLAMLDEFVGDILDFRAWLYRGSHYYLSKGIAHYLSYYLEHALADPASPGDLYPDLVGETFGIQALGSLPFDQTLIQPGVAYPLASQAQQGNVPGIWSAAFYELDHAIGGDTFVTLLLDAMKRLTTYSAPPQLLDALLEADQALHNSAHADVLNSIFTKYQLDRETTSTQTLSINQSVQLEAGYHDLDFMTDASAEAFSFTTSGPFERLEIHVFDQAGAVQNRMYFFNKSHPLSIPIASSGTPFQILPNARYQFLLTATEPITVSVSTDVALPETRTLSENQAESVGDHQAFFLQSDRPFDRILLEIPGARDDEFSAFMSPNGPEIEGTVGFGGVSNSFANTEVTSVLLNPFVDEPVNQIYLSLPDLAPNATLRWQGINLQDAEALTVGGEALETTRQVGDAGLAAAPIQFQNPTGQAVIRTDASTPFSLVTRDGYLADASIIDGAYQLLVHRDGSSFGANGQFYRVSVISLTRSSLLLKATPGTTVPITIEPQVSLPSEIISAETSQEITLQPNELRIFEVISPQGQSGFQTTFTPTTSGRLIHQLFDSDYDRLFNDSFFEVGDQPQTLSFQSEPYLVRAGINLANSSYFHWIRNQSDQPTTFTLQTRFTQDVIEPVTVDASGTHTLNWYAADTGYFAPLTIPVPAGVKGMSLRATGYLLDIQHFQFDRFKSGQEEYLQLNLSDIEDSKFEDEGFYRIWLRSMSPEQPDAAVNLELEWRYDIVPYSLDDNQNWRPTLSTNHGSSARIATTENLRGLIVAWDTQQMPEDYQLAAILTRDNPIFSSFVPRKAATQQSNPWLQLQSQQSLIPIPAENWYLYQGFDRANFDMNDDQDRSPFELPSKVVFLPMETDTQLPPTATEAQSNLAIREVQVINPSDTAQSLQWNNETVEIPAGGFIQRQLTASETLNLNAAAPLAIFERQSGEAWETVTAPSPYRQHDIFLPHLPPASSGWQTMATLAHAGGAQASIVSGSESQTTSVASGIDSYTLPKDQLGSWSRLQTQAPTGALTPEATLSGTQYWTQDGHFAAEPMGVGSAKVLFVPHFPKVADWWVGLTLANPNDREIQLTIAPYGVEGLLFDQVRHVNIPANQSSTGLLEAFIDIDAVNDVQWMRIHCDDASFAGLAFIGTWRNGDDVAAFSLPTQTSTGLLFPGPNSENWYGVAVTNTVAATGTVTVEAVGPDGSTLASFEETLAPNEKLLFTGTSRFPELGYGDYYLRVTAEQIRVSGLIIGGNGGKALSAQTPVLLP